MQKIILYGIGNEKEFNHYTFEKTKNAHKKITKILSKLFEINWPTQDESHDENDDYNPTEIDISKHKDFHQNISSSKNKNNRLDIFYGNKKIFITIHCSLKKRKTFNDELRKITKMPKPSKPINPKMIKS